MRIPTWRIALTGVAVVILLGLGIGFAYAATTTPPTAGSTGLAAGTAAPAASGAPNVPGTGIRRWLLNHPRIAAALGARLGVAKHLVHVTATFTDQNGNLVTIQIDHGTIESIGNGSLSINEAGGSTVTVSTDANTVVRMGRNPGALSDLKVGDTVFVQSRIDGSTIAKHILDVPAGTTTGS
jgi:hypothetical protein